MHDCFAVVIDIGSTSELCETFVALLLLWRQGVGKQETQSSEDISDGQCMDIDMTGM